jgi:hypothetical protein
MQHETLKFTCKLNSVV